MTMRKSAIRFFEIAFQSKDCEVFDYTFQEQTLATFVRYSKVLYVYDTVAGEDKVARRYQSVIGRLAKNHGHTVIQAKSPRFSSAGTRLY